MLRIATTSIDLYNRFLCDEEFPEEVFISQLTKKTPATKYMQLGSAFHEILEDPWGAYNRHAKLTSHEGNFMSKEGIVFPDDVIRPCFDFIDYDHPFEIKLTKNYAVISEFNPSGFEPVEVVAKVDQGKGNFVIEHKSCWTQFKYDKYADSLQWKFYLDIFQAQRCIYKVFELSDLAGGIKFRQFHSFHFDWHEGIPKELETILESFIKFIYTKNLQEFFS